MSLDKPRRTTSEAFREWLRPAGCIIQNGSCWGRPEFHHEKRRGARGSDPLLGGSDFCGFWVCSLHHNIAQSHRAQFELALGMSIWQWLFRQLYLYAMERGLLEVDGDEIAAGVPA